MNIYGDIVDSGCNGEVLSDGVIEEEGNGGEVDEDDRVMNENDQSFSTHVTRTVLTDGVVVWEGVRWQVLLRKIVTLVSKFTTPVLQMHQSVMGHFRVTQHCLDHRHMLHCHILV